MIPTNPMLHCPLIGSMGMMDPNHHFKCDDTAECSADEGQNAWPPVSAIGANTPTDVRQVFEQSNVGFETEPFGCAIPTTETDHPMRAKAAQKSRPRDTLLDLWYPSPPFSGR